MPYPLRPPESPLSSRYSMVGMTACQPITKSRPTALTIACLPSARSDPPNRIPPPEPIPISLSVPTRIGFARSESPTCELPGVPAGLPSTNGLMTGWSESTACQPITKSRPTAPTIDSLPSARSDPPNRIPPPEPIPLSPSFPIRIGFARSESPTCELLGVPAGLPFTRRLMTGWSESTACLPFIRSRPTAPTINPLPSARPDPPDRIQSPGPIPLSPSFPIRIGFARSESPTREPSGVPAGLPFPAPNDGMTEPFHAFTGPLRRSSTVKQWSLISAACSSPAAPNCWPSRPPQKNINRP